MAAASTPLVDTWIFSCTKLKNTIERFIVLDNNHIHILSLFQEVLNDQKDNVTRRPDAPAVV
jgi:hypothetical protein